MALSSQAGLDRGASQYRRRELHDADNGCLFPARVVRSELIATAGVRRAG